MKSFRAGLVAPILETKARAPWALAGDTASTAVRRIVDGVNLAAVLELSVAIKEADSALKDCALAFHAGDGRPDGDTFMPALPAIVRVSPGLHLAAVLVGAVAIGEAWRTLDLAAPFDAGCLAVRAPAGKPTGAAVLRVNVRVGGALPHALAVLKIAIADVRMDIRTLINGGALVASRQTKPRGPEQATNNQALPHPTPEPTKS